MNLKFSYDMRIDFSDNVFRHHYSMKCIPHDTERQRIKNVSVEICPGNKIVSDKDCFGNIISRGYIGDGHDFFTVSVNGNAQTGFAVYEEKDGETDMFLLQTKFTQPGREIDAFHKKLSISAPEKIYDRTLYYMRNIYDKMCYIPGVTDMNTTAERAFTKRCGVCQDYAQILISLLRKDGIPARYAAGMMIGEGATHAWTEAYLNGCWYGFDPTNNLLTDDYYIKISHGRDHRDCMVSRGVFFGSAKQNQKIHITVEEK